MGGLLDALGIGRSGLNAARAGVQLTGHNITNANTEGFHRRTLQLEPVSPPPVFGGGVNVIGVARAEDRLLGRQVNSLLGEESFADARQTAMLQLQQAATNLGEHGIGSAIGDLFASFSALGSRPQGSAERQQVLVASQRVADAFNSAASRLETVAAESDTEISVLVKEANNAAAAVAQLNAQIGEAEAAGQDASDLKDQRDLNVQHLSKLVGATSFLDSDGQVSVLAGSMTLVQGDHAAQLQATPDANLGGRNRVDLVDGNSAVDITSRLGGRIGGLISVRDTEVPSTTSALDQLAYDLVASPGGINAVHRAGYGLDGVNNRDLFTPLGAATGAAAALQMNTSLTGTGVAASSSAATLPGNNENALALAAIATTQIANGNTQTVTDQLASVVGRVGTNTAEALTVAELKNDQLSSLQMLKQSTEGVSVDEEMIHLVQYQRTYQASARVLQTIDQLLARLMEL